MELKIGSRGQLGLLYNVHFPKMHIGRDLNTQLHACLVLDNTVFFLVIYEWSVSNGKKEGDL